MRIAFVLPGPSLRPSGGYRVVFLYADALRAFGHDVDLLVPRLRADRRRWRQPAAVLWPAVRRLPSRPRWQPGVPSESVREVLALTAAAVAPYEVVVATGWDTAEDLGKTRPDGHGCAYLIQGFEDWTGPRARVEATWRLPFHRVVIAQWLAERAAELGALPVAHVPNAIDTTLFRRTRPAAARVPRTVGLMLHPDSIKGSDVGLAALARAREQHPDIHVLAFSAYDRPCTTLPDWVELVIRPTPESLVDLYNRMTVFVSPSRSEGWALPPAEAMACGTAVVCTDIGGVRDYAQDGVTAVLTPVDDPMAMSEAVCRLLVDDTTRQDLADRAYRQIRETFSWSASSKAFERELVQAAAR